MLEWIAQMHDNLIEGAPTILPMDLLGHRNVEAYLRRMVVLDLEAPSPGVRQVATQVAKLLFTDSIVSDSPIVPFNPLEYRGRGGAVNLIERLAEAHREDCERLQASVPLIIGVADEHAEVARSGVPHPFMYFDASLDVRVRGEACVPLLDARGQVDDGAGPQDRYVRTRGRDVARRVDRGRHAEHAVEVGDPLAGDRAGVRRGPAADRSAAREHGPVRDRRRVRGGEARGFARVAPGVPDEG